MSPAYQSYSLTWNSLVTACCLLGALFNVCWSKQQRQPHIVLVVADDLGWNDVGWHNKHVLTPHLDTMARKGVVLDSHYVLPSCTPSRNSLLTGMYPYHTKLQSAFDPSHKMYLPLKHKTIAERLKEEGYATHMVGKWHLGYCNQKYTPTSRGFDSFFGFHIGSQDYYSHTKQDRITRENTGDWSLFSASNLLMKSFIKISATGLEGGKDFWFNDTIWTETEGEYSTHVFARRATDIIARHDPKTPLFLYLPFQAVHAPITVPKRYQKLYSHVRSPQRRMYLGMVSALDEAIGNITSALYQYGFMDNLLFVFTSDNGGQPYTGANNLPLRGGKSTLWEGGTRVPTFIFSPTLIRKRGYRSNRLMHASDWFPTFVRLAGGQPEASLDGVDQWRMLSMNGLSARSEMVYHIEKDGRGAIRIGDYKMIIGKPGRYNDWYPSMDFLRINKKRFKGGRYDKSYVGDELYRLYDLRSDPYERHNIAFQRPAVLDAMLHRYRILNATKVEPFPKLSDPGSDPSYFGGYWSPGWC